jgi:HSP20 family protein
MHEVFENFDTIVESFLRPTYATTVNFQPSCDLQENEGHYMVSFDMPGVKKENIKIEVQANQLHVSGERQRESKKDVFERTFVLPESVDAEKIEAHYEDGVLNIALPKAEKAKARKIEIQSGHGGFFSKLLGGKSETREIKDAKVS